MTAPVRTHRLVVHHDRTPEATNDVAPEDRPADERPADEQSTLPYVEPQEYGLRVSWQSEAVRIEAAEFLVATRVQESSRRRLARAMLRMREQVRADRRA